jgi:WD40 repeat protein
MLLKTHQTAELSEVRDPLRLPTIVVCTDLCSWFVLCSDMVSCGTEAFVWLAGVCIQTRTGNIKGVQSIALSPDASMVVAGSDDTTARVYGFQHS